VRYSPREEIIVKLFVAYEMLDLIQEFEEDIDGADIEEETSWENPEIRKTKIQEFLAWVKSNEVDTTGINIEFDQHRSSYAVSTRKSFPADKEIFRVPSDISFSIDIRYHTKIPLDQIEKNREPQIAEEYLIVKVIKEI